MRKHGVFHNQNSLPRHRIAELEFWLAKKKNNVIKLVEDKNQLILSSLKDYVIFLDADLKISYINHVYPWVNLDDVIGSHWLDWVDKADHAHALECLQSTLKTKQPSCIEYRVVGMHKETTWYEVTILYLPEITGKGVILISQDITERKRTREALVLSESRYLLLFENMMEGAQIIGFDWHYLYINNSGAKAGRRLKEDLLGHTIMECYPGFENTEMYFELNRCMRERISEKKEFEFVYPDGEISWFIFSIQPVPEGLFIISLDISDRKKIEAALGESEERYRLIVETLSLGVVIHADNKVLFANQAAVNLVGGSDAKEFIGKPFGSFMDPKDRDFIMHLIDASFAAKVNFSPMLPRMVEERLIKLDGSIITVETSAVLINYYGKPALLVMMNDITERKQAEAALRESEERLRAFFMSGVMGTMFADVYGNINLINDKLLNILGFTREEFNKVKLGWTDLTPPEYISLDVAGIEEAKKRGLCTPYEKQYFRKDGSRVWVLIGYVLVGPKRDESIAFVLDLSNIKQKEDEINQLNAELEQRVAQRTKQLEIANKELEAFTYSVSHDLRAPLRLIDGFSRIVLDDYAEQLDHEGRRYLNLIRENISKMSQLTTDLLTLSKTTETELQLSRIDMAQLAVETYEEIIPAETREKFIFYAGNLPHAWGDVALLRQVWGNLLSNAIKYTFPKEEKRIEIGGYLEKDMAIYYVKDNGIGFDPALAYKLFGVFQRLDNAEGFEGTGVGLAIVQRIVGRHGGHVWAEGKLNAGASIYFAIPQK
jgi:PAS domain S-box-containing protein